MLYTTLGRTNRKVSRIGFGGCPAGVKNYVETYDPGKTDDYGEGVRAARRAYELGINYFDTAPGYGNGLSEQIIGRLLMASPERISLWQQKYVTMKNQMFSNRLKAA